MKKIKIEGPLALAVCALFWSLAGVFMKFVNINSFALAGFRSLIAFFTIMIFSRRIPRFFIYQDSKENVQTKKIDTRKTLYLWLAGLSYAATMILFCVSNKLTYSANAVLLQYTYPVWVIAFGPMILGEKNKRVDYFTIVFVFIGMLLFFAEDLFGVKTDEFKDTKVLGNILALVSGITFAGTTIFQRKQQLISESECNNSFDSFMIAQIVTALFGLPFVFILPDGRPDMQSMIFLLLLGVVQMGIPNITYSIGIKKVKAFSASLITMLEPLMNPIWVLIFVHEIPGLLCVFGGVIIIGSVLWREFNAGKN